MYKRQVSIKSIKLLNNLKSDLIRIDQKLKLPIEGISEDKNNIKIASKNYKIIDKTIVYRHKIKRYDNWYKIARKYDVPLKKLLKWNNANKQTTLKINKLVKIKLRGPILIVSKKTKPLRYVVSSGERYDQIIRGFGISKDTLIKDNNLKNKKYLTAGDNLIINQN